MMEEKKLNVSVSIAWPEKYSDKAFKLLKQSLGLFFVFLALLVFLIPGEYLLIFSFVAFLYTFLIGITSLVGLVSKKTQRKYYIQSIIAVIVSLSLIFLHLYVGYAIAGHQKKTMTIARRIVCSVNLKTLSSQCLYHASEKSWPSPDWCDILQMYNFDLDDFKCPIDKIGPCSYAMNENIPVDVGELPPDLVLLFESAPGWNQIGGVDDVVTDRHGKPGANIAFADGHIEFVKTEDIPTLRWRVEQKRGAEATR